MMISRQLIWLFDRLSIRNKVLAGYAALTIPFVTLTIFAGAMTAELLAESKHVDEDSIPTLDALETIRTAGLTVIGQTNGLVLIRAIGADAPVAGGAVDPAADLQAARSALSQAVHDFLNLATDGDDETFHGSIQFATSDITRQSERLIRLAADRKSSAIVLQLRERFERSAGSFRTLIQSAIDAERIDLTARREQLSGTIWFTAVLVVGLGLMCVLGAILGGLRVSNRIARPIQRLRDAAIRVGEGEFNVVDQRQTADEVGELVTAFQTMVERLKEMMGRLSSQERLAALGQLAGSVSHELRNPLGVLRNSLFSLREAVEGNAAGNAANTGKIIDRIERNVQRCNTIVTDLLNYARTGQLDRRDVEIDAWLSEMLDEHELPAGITLRRELESGAAVLLDRNRFRQVLVNLLDNATQAMGDAEWLRSKPRERAITVRTAGNGPDLILSVRDTGPGISADVLPKVFDPLFTTKSFGVGLGLPTVRQIVQQHGGTIEVESVPGESTIFTVRLPRDTRQQDEAA